MITKIWNVILALLLITFVVGSFAFIISGYPRSPQSHIFITIDEQGNVGQKEK